MIREENCTSSVRKSNELRGFCCGLQSFEGFANRHEKTRRNQRENEESSAGFSLLLLPLPLIEVRFTSNQPPTMIKGDLEPNPLTRNSHEQIEKHLRTTSSNLSESENEHD